MTRSSRPFLFKSILGFAAFACLSANARAAEPAPSTAVPVGVSTVIRQNYEIYVNAVGAVQAYNTVAVHPQADGQVVKITFKDGQEVRIGDLLAQIDPRPYQASLDAAIAKKAQDQALLTNAKTDLQRYYPLAEKNYATRQQVDTTEARVSQLEAAIKGDDAAIETARIQLSYTDIRSPIDGQTGIRQIDQGNILHGGLMGTSSSSPETLVLITQLHPIYVVFAIPQKDLPRVREGRRSGSLSVAVLNKEDNQLLDKGVLEAVDNQIDPATGTIKLKAKLPNTDEKLWPGQYVNTKLHIQTKADTITIPAQAIQSGPQGPYVFVVKPDKTVETRAITVGGSDDEIAEVEHGLEAGEIVVTSGHYRLRPGVKVEPHGNEAHTETGKQS